LKEKNIVKSSLPVTRRSGKVMKGKVFPFPLKKKLTKTPYTEEKKKEGSKVLRKMVATR